MADIQILLVDDHEIVRDGLKTVLQNQHGLFVAAEANDGKEACRACRDHSIDLVIMDINMPGQDGISATEEILSEFPEIRVLALTMSDEDLHVRKMIQAGASGYITKESANRKELSEAIHEIMAGRHYFSSEATRSIMLDLIENRGRSRSIEGTSITRREEEVLRLIVEEYTNQEIADELYISVRTVDAHRRNLMQKSGSKNTAGLVRFAIEKGLIAL
ncbi:MAG: response regulator transcription factor [Balneolaceae bacterium]